MSTEPPPSDSHRGKHTLAGDGEPAVEKHTDRFQAWWALREDGEKMLVMHFTVDGSDVNMAMSGDNLFKFYAMVKKGMEGSGRRPDYLG